MVLGEVPTGAALLGVGLIVAGSYALVDRAGGRGFVTFWRDRGVQFRLAALVLSAVEAVFLKRAVLAAEPVVTFAAWAALGFLVALPFGLVPRGRGGRPPEDARPRWHTFALLALTTGLMQYTTIVAFTGFPVAAALALFQTSTLVTVLLGWRVFNEKDVGKRFGGALVMAAGAVLIVLNR